MMGYFPIKGQRINTGMEEALPTPYNRIFKGSFAAVTLGVIVAAVPAVAAEAEMVKYTITGTEHESAINKSLTGKAGDPARGRKIAINRKKGNCLACHEVTVLKDQPYHGEVGPSLDGAASRYKPGQLRMMIVNQKVYFPETIMPAMYKNKGLTRVKGKFKGKPILTAQEVEDVLAFILTLKEG